MPPLLPVHAARDLFLHAQGLLDDPARPASPAALLDLIRRLGFVQIDSINVVGRAHHLTLFSRLDDHDPAHLTRLLERDRALFEHWTHDASVIPSEFFPYWRHRFARFERRLRANAWWNRRLGEDAERLLEHVHELVRREGPLMTKDLRRDAAASASASNPWWGWSREKAAIEYLWWTGRVGVAARRNFHKVYDLFERVLPAHHPPSAAAGDEAPDEPAFVDFSCRAAIERLVVATPAEIARFWGSITLAEARAFCDRARREGLLVPVRVEAADGSAPQAAFALADWRERLDRVPPAPDRARLLSPFDPVIRERDRARRRFNLDYRFEAFVPASKRRDGYYVLPVLQGDRFLARVDPKFDRANDELVVRLVRWEPGVRPTRARRAALDEAVNRLALQLGATWYSIAE